MVVRYHRKTADNKTADIGVHRFENGLNYVACCALLLKLRARNAVLQYSALYHKLVGYGIEYFTLKKF